MRPPSIVVPSKSSQVLMMVATGQEMVREKNSSRSGKCQGILLWVGKIGILKKSQGKLKL